MLPLLLWVKVLNFSRKSTNTLVKKFHFRLNPPKKKDTEAGTENGSGGRGLISGSAALLPRDY